VLTKQPYPARSKHTDLNTIPDLYGFPTVVNILVIAISTVFAPACTISAETKPAGPAEKSTAITYAKSIPNGTVTF
jgi:hypothetical protein